MDALNARSGEAGITASADEDLTRSRSHTSDAKDVKANDENSGADVIFIAHITPLITLLRFVIAA